MEKYKFMSEKLQIMGFRFQPHFEVDVCYFFCDVFIFGLFVCFCYFILFWVLLLLVLVFGFCISLGGDLTFNSWDAENVKHWNHSKKYHLISL